MDERLPGGMRVAPQCVVLRPEGEITVGISRTAGLAVERFLDLHGYVSLPEGKFKKLDEADSKKSPELDLDTLIETVLGWRIQYVPGSHLPPVVLPSKSTVGVDALFSVKTKTLYVDDVFSPYNSLEPGADVVPGLGKPGPRESEFYMLLGTILGLREMYPNEPDSIYVPQQPYSSTHLTAARVFASNLFLPEENLHSALFAEPEDNSRIADALRQYTEPRPGMRHRVAQFNRYCLEIAQEYGTIPVTLVAFRICVSRWRFVPHAVLDAITGGAQSDDDLDAGAGVLR